MVVAGVLTLTDEADELEHEITRLVTDTQPELLALPGVGAISAARILISCSHPGRFRSEAAFATFFGAAPIAALKAQAQAKLRTVIASEPNSAMTRSCTEV